MIPQGADTPVADQTSYASLRSQVDSMKLAPSDYIAQTLLTWRNAPAGRAHSSATARHDAPAPSIGNDRHQSIGAPAETPAGSQPVRSFMGIIGTARPWQTCFKRIQQVAQPDSTVPDSSESGPARNWVARRPA